MIVLNTRYATENVPSTLVVAKSPIVTPTASPPGLARSRATIARDRSMPWTGTPRRASGKAIRPVPTPSSSARLEPVRRLFVVGRRHPLPEVAILIAHRRTVPQNTPAVLAGFRAPGGG